MALLVRFFRFVLPIALLLLAAIAVPLKVFDARGLDRVRRLERELAGLKEANRKIERENGALRAQVQSFHADPDYLERVARDELGMVAADEVIYQFPDDGKEAPPAPPDPPDPSETAEPAAP